MKKVLAILLSVLIVVNILPVHIFATTGEDVTQIEEQVQDVVEEEVSQVEEEIEEPEEIEIIEEEIEQISELEEEFSNKEEEILEQSLDNEVKEETPIEEERTLVFLGAPSPDVWNYNPDVDGPAKKTYFNLGDISIDDLAKAVGVTLGTLLGAGNTLTNAKITFDGGLEETYTDSETTFSDVEAGTKIKCIINYSYKKSFIAEAEVKSTEGIIEVQRKINLASFSAPKLTVRTSSYSPKPEDNVIVKQGDNNKAYYYKTGSTSSSWNYGIKDSDIFCDGEDLTILAPNKANYYKQVVVNGEVLTPKDETTYVYSKDNFTSDLDITVSYIPENIILVQPDNGTLSISDKGSNKYTFSVKPNDGYFVSEIKVNEVSKELTYKASVATTSPIEILEESTITATLTPEIVLKDNPVIDTRTNKVDELTDKQIFDFIVKTNNTENIEDKMVDISTSTDNYTKSAPIIGPVSYLKHTVIEYMYTSEEVYEAAKKLKLDDLCWTDINPEEATLASVLSSLRNNLVEQLKIDESQLATHSFGEGYKLTAENNQLEMIRIRFYEDDYSVLLNPLIPYAIPSGNHPYSMMTNGRWECEVTLNDGRTPVYVTFDNEKFETEYDYDYSLTDLYGDLFKLIKLSDSEGQPVIIPNLTAGDFTFQGIDTTSITSGYVNVTAKFNGNDEYKMATVDGKLPAIQVKINPATISKFTVNAENKAYDGLPEEVVFKVIAKKDNKRLDPTKVKKSYIIVGGENDIEGYVGIHIDTEDMIIKVPNNSEFINNILTLIAKNDALAKSIGGYIPGFDKLLNEIIESIEDGNYTNPLISEFVDKIIESVINIFPVLKDCYKDRTFNYGQLILNGVNEAIALKNSNSLENLIKTIQGLAKLFGISDYADNLDKLVSLVESTIKEIKKYDRINLVVIKDEKDIPRNAGAYLIMAAITDKNYKFALNTMNSDTFVISSVFNGSIEWNKEIGKSSFISKNLRILNVRAEELEIADFDAHYVNVNEETYIDNLTTVLGDKTKAQNEYNKETTCKYLYFGGEIITENDIKNVVEDMKNVKTLQDLTDFIEKYNKLYVGEDVSKIDFTAGGLYVEIAYVLGNFVEGAARVFTIIRVDTDIHLDSVTVDYAGKDTPNNVVSAINAKSNYITAEDTGYVLETKDGKVVDEKEYKDLEDKSNIVRPEIYYFGLDTGLKVYSPSKNAPTNAGVYLMYGRYVGNKTYKGTSTVLDYIEDAGELTKMLTDLLTKLITNSKDKESNIEYEEFLAQAKKLGLPILTINKKKVDVSWDPAAITDLGAEIKDGRLTYTYLGQNGKDVKDYVLLTGAASDDDVKASVVGGLKKDASQTILPYTLTVKLTGKDANNYYLTDILFFESDYATLSYRINKKTVEIDWNLFDYTDAEIVDETLKYVYRGQTSDVTKYVDVDGLYLEDKVDKVITDFDLTSKINPNAGKHKLVVALTGEDAKNYIVSYRLIGSRIDSLDYEITKAPITVSWKEDFETPYTYNANINYLEDKYSYEGVISGETELVDVVIASGKEKDVGKHTIKFALTGKFIPLTLRRYSDNYELVIDSLDYEITPKQITASWNEELGEVKDSKLQLVYNGKVQNPSSSQIKLDGVITGLRVKEDVSVSITNKNNSINVGEYTSNIELTGKDAKNYILNNSSLNYDINQKPVTVTWTKVMFDVNDPYKIPEYIIEGIEPIDKKQIHLLMTFINTETKEHSINPQNEGIYLANVWGINNKNYSIEFTQTLFTVVDTKSIKTTEGTGWDINAGAITYDGLLKQGGKVEIKDAPTKDQALGLLGNLDKDLYDAFNKAIKDKDVYRIMSLSLRGNAVDINDFNHKTVKEAFVKKLGEGVVKKAYFFDLDLFTTVSGVRYGKYVDDAKYNVPIAMTFSKDSYVAKNIIGNRKAYVVVRYHDGTVTPITHKLTSDGKGNYTFTFESDKFSTYGIYSYDLPDYIIPNTGVNE